MEAVTPFIFAGFTGASIIISGIFLYLNFREKLVTYRLFALIAFIFAIDCAFSVFMLSKGYRTEPDLIGWTRPLIFVYGPLFFLTFSIITGYNSKVRADHVLHFLPFATHFMLMIPFILKTPATKIFLYEHYVKGVAYIEYYPHFMMFMKVLFFFIYSLIPFVLTRKYSKMVREFYSTIDNVKIVKMYVISIAYLLSSVVLIHIFYGYLTGPSFIRPDIPYFFYYFLVLPVILTAVFAITDRNFLKCEISTVSLLSDDGEEETENEDENAEKPQKYAKNKMPDEMADAAAKQLIEIMKEKKPFIDSNLTLVDLAKMIHIRPYHLSQLINSRFDENFYVFVNSARIKYAAELLKDPAHKEKSILEIAYEAGFNSKSAFNTYFRNIMGETPSNFRKK